MKMISFFKKVIKWAAVSIFAVILLGMVYVIYCWSRCNCVNTDIERILPNDRKSIVAVFGPDKKTMPKIRVDRFLFKEPFKYPFYSPQYYSDYFRIDFKFNDSLIYVVDDKDTVRWGDLYLLDTVPSRIKGYDYSRMLMVTYYQDTIFKSNVEHKPSVFILKQLSAGPIGPSCFELAKPNW